MLSSSKVSVQGSEVASAVQSLAEEFQAGDAEREPASENGGLGAQDSGSVFERTREAYVRCIRRGCVTSAR